MKGVMLVGVFIFLSSNFFFSWAEEYYYQNEYYQQSDEHPHGYYYGVKLEEREKEPPQPLLYPKEGVYLSGKRLRKSSLQREILDPFKYEEEKKYYKKSHVLPRKKIKRKGINPLEKIFSWLFELDKEFQKHWW